MAIEKMKLLSLVGAREEEDAILQELVLCEKVHMNVEHSDTYSNNYIMHEYEAMLPAAEEVEEENYAETESTCQRMIAEVEKMALDMQIDLKIDLQDIKSYTRKKAIEDIERLKEKLGPSIETMTAKRKEIETLTNLNNNLGFIKEKIDFSLLNRLQYIQYEVGRLSRENRVHIRKNYENISALILEIGEIEASKEDIYIVFYLKELEEETHRLLKSLNWHKLEVGTSLQGNVEECISENNKKIDILKKQITVLETSLYDSKEQMEKMLDKIYSRLKLELKMLELKMQLFRGSNVFILTAWIRSCDYKKLEETIASITDKYVMMAKKPSELDEGLKPPTKLKNNWFTRPFEMIVGLYGIPNYHEIDPTPFLAITFCLMFGIMFGDVGQGFIYLLAGFLISKKMPMPGGILKRLGGTSMIFGLVYGSVFGLEEVPWIKEHAIVQGGPLNTLNIMPILIAGVAFGVAVLTISFIFGMINAVRRGDYENAILGKNGVAGYIFFMGLICSGLCIVGIIPISVAVPLLVMVLMLVLMLFKEPLAHLVQGVRPLINGDKGSYYIESGFEGIETILSTLSNAISFIRVGAFALNHAGLFMAFAVMAEMVSNPIIKVFILILGNILILVLEGLVVFIQGLRLQYYEMFSKYFNGDGIAYSPVKLEK